MKVTTTLVLMFLSLSFICGCKRASESAESNSESKNVGIDGSSMLNCNELYFYAINPFGHKIGPNQPVTLQWTIPGYDQVEIEGVTERLNQSFGKRIVTPAVTTTYRLRAFKGTVEVPAIFETVVGVERVGGPSAIGNIRLQFPAVKPNEVNTIYWQVSGCSQVRLTGIGRNDEWECQADTMFTAVAIPETQDFILSIIDSLGRVVGFQSVTVTVQP